MSSPYGSPGPFHDICPCSELSSDSCLASVAPSFPAAAAASTAASQAIGIMLQTVFPSPIAADIISAYVQSTRITPVACNEVI